jgi:hypothetical protein
MLSIALMFSVGFVLLIAVAILLIQLDFRSLLRRK